MAVIIHTARSVELGYENHTGTKYLIKNAQKCISGHDSAPDPTNYSIFHTSGFWGKG